MIRIQTGLLTNSLSLGCIAGMESRQLLDIPRGERRHYQSTTTMSPSS